MPHDGSAQDAQISAALQRLVQKLRRRMEFVEQSKFSKARALWRALKARFGLRVDPEPPLPAREYVEAMDAGDAYARWLVEHEPRTSDLKGLGQIAQALERRPSICIIVDDALGTADDAVGAVKAQVYPWSRLLCTSKVSRSKDAAVRFNSALEACEDEFVAFCDPDELLAPDACFEVALALCESPDAGVIYGDRDMVAPNGRRATPLFVPDWSPETFLSQMYTGRLIFYRREAVISAGGFRLGFGTALHYDLALRVTEHCKSIEHRAHILYHEQEEGHEATDRRDAAKAISSALERRGEQGRVEHPYAGVDSNIVRYSITRPGRVEIILPTRDLPVFLDRCLTSVFAHTTYEHFRVNVVDNGSVEPETAAILTDWKAREPERFRVMRLDQPFNFSRLVNAAAKPCDGPYLLLLNNDMEVITNDWIEAMIEQAQRTPIGAVGARLLYGDRTLQHAGVVVGLGTLAGHVYRHAASDDPGPGGAILTVRNYSAVTAACLMVRREVFEEARGFDERLAIEFNDVDFCLRLLRLGHRNVYLPHVVLLHYESQSRGTSTSSSKHARNDADRALLRERWQTSTFEDRYYNCNLTTITDDGAIAPP
jgi:GT2 family glycosyltransferase